MSETIEGKTRSVGPLAAQMARLMSKAQAEAIAPLELAPAQFAVLRELWKADGQTQAELARKLEVEQATMANTLKRMIRDGLVAGEPHPADRRAIRVRVTERAKLLEKPAKAAVKRVNIKAVGDLSEKERKRFVELSRRVIASLKDETPAVSPDA